MTQIIEKPRTAGPGSGLGFNARVIVKNDNHNTFEGVAFILSKILPATSLERGFEHAVVIHNAGEAVVWEGNREAAELYHEQLVAAGLTMAPLA